MRNSYRQKLLATFAVVAAFAFLLPAAASAQQISAASDPENAQYGDQSKEFEGAVNRSDPTDPTDSGTASAAAIEGLPFTGADLIVLAAGAFVLVGTGLILRRQASVNE
jgi:hypothetical protein